MEQQKNAMTPWKPGHIRKDPWSKSLSYERLYPLMLLSPTPLTPLPIRSVTWLTEHLLLASLTRTCLSVLPCWTVSTTDLLSPFRLRFHAVLLILLLTTPTHPCRFGNYSKWSTALLTSLVLTQHSLFMISPNWQPIPTITDLTSHAAVSVTLQDSPVKATPKNGA